MFKFKNEQPPKAKEEKAKKTLARLEQVKEKIRAASYGAAGITILAGGVAGALAGLEIGGIAGVVPVGIAGIGLSIPVATAVAAVPVVIKDIISLRIKALQNRFSSLRKMRPTDEIINEQKENVEKQIKEYEAYEKSETSKKSEIDAQKEKLENEKNILNVYEKAKERAQIEKKEKTIQRLMNIATSESIRDASCGYGTLSVIEAGIGAIVNKVGNSLAASRYIEGQAISPYVKAGASICFAAAAYEAVKTAILIPQSIKEKRASHKAFKILEAYARYR